MLSVLTTDFKNLIELTGAHKYTHTHKTCTHILYFTCMCTNMYTHNHTHTQIIQPHNIMHTHAEMFDKNKLVFSILTINQQNVLYVCMWDFDSIDSHYQHQLYV